MWEEEADCSARESLLSPCYSPSGQQPPPLPQDKGPSVCQLLGKQQAFLSLSSPERLSRDPSLPPPKGMAHPLLLDLCLLNDPETEAGKAGIGAISVWWVNPYISAIPSFGQAAQARASVLPRWTWGVAGGQDPAQVDLTSSS